MIDGTEQYTLLEVTISYLDFDDDYAETGFTVYEWEDVDLRIDECVLELELEWARRIEVSKEYVF